MPFCGYINTDFPLIQNHSTELFAGSTILFPDHEAGEKADADSPWELLVQNRIKKTLIEIVGPENYTEKLIDLISYSYDASTYDNRPDCILWGTSTGQISQILDLANRERIPVVPGGPAPAFAVAPSRLKEALFLTCPG